MSWNHMFTQKNPEKTIFYFWKIGFFLSLYHGREQVNAKSHRCGLNECFRKPLPYGTLLTTTNKTMKKINRK